MEECKKERLANALDEQRIVSTYLRQFCSENELSYRFSITNEGHHWRVRVGKTFIEWWPSSGRVALNRNYKGRRFVMDVDRFVGFIHDALLEQLKQSVGPESN